MIAVLTASWVIPLHAQDGHENINSNFGAIVNVPLDLSATKSTHGLGCGFSNIYALTGNYRLESRGKKFVHFIAGGGCIMAPQMSRNWSSLTAGHLANRLGSGGDSSARPGR